jgi:DNA-binding NtrC family response regulator
LRNKQYEIFQALQRNLVRLADGAQALKIFTNNDFDCVITDLRMPNLSGMELLEKIKTINTETPVVVITAFGEVETAVSAMKAGAFDYINKPFNRDEILLTLERALSFSETKNENRRLRSCCRTAKS